MNVACLSMPVVVALERDRRIVLRAETGSIRSVDTITFQDDEHGVVVVYDARLDAKGTGGSPLPCWPSRSTASAIAPRPDCVSTSQRSRRERLDGARRFADAALEATVVGSFSRVGFAARRALFDWDAEPLVDLRGRVALVTGATGGLGLAAATALAARDADVWIVGRDADRTDAAPATDRWPSRPARVVTTAVADLGVLDDVRNARRPCSASDVAARRARPQRRRARARSAHHRRRPRAHRAGARRRAVPADDALLPLLRRTPGARVITVSSGGMYTQRLDLDALEHAADAVRRRARLRQRQAGPGRAERELVGAAPAAARRHVPRHAPRMGRHARGAGVAAALPRGDAPAAAHAEPGRRHHGVARGRTRGRSRRTARSGSTAAAGRPTRLPWTRTSTPTPTGSGTGASSAPASRTASRRVDEDRDRRDRRVGARRRAPAAPRPRRHRLRGRRPHRRPRQHRRRRRSTACTTRSTPASSSTTRRNYPGFVALLARARRRDAADRDELQRHRRRDRPRVPRLEPQHALRPAPQPRRTRRSSACSPRSSRFNRAARRLVADEPRVDGRRPAARTGDEPTPTTSRSATFVRRGRYSDAFVEQFLVPFGASIWSADPATFTRFPVRAYARFMHNHGLLEPRRPAAVAHDHRRLPHATSTRSIAPFADRIRLATPVHKIVARRAPTARTSVELLTDARTRALRPGDRRRAQRPGAAAARRPDAGRARDPRRDRLPAQHRDAAHRRVGCCPRNPRARASWNYRVDRRRAARDRHLLDEHAAVRSTADRPLLVTLNRRDAIDPTARARRVRVRPPGLRRRRDARPSAAATRSRAPAASTSPARTGATASTRTACRARSRSAAAIGATTDDARPRRRTRATAHAHVGASRAGSGREFAPRLFLAYLDVDALPGSLDALPRLVGPPPRAGALPAPRLPRRRRRRRSATRSATSSRQRLGRRPDGPVHLLAHLRTFGWLFNPLAVYYCWDRRRRRARRRRARGDEHAVGRAPLVRVRRPRRRAIDDRRRRRCTCRRSSRWTSTTASRGRRRATTSRLRIDVERDGTPHLRRPTSRCGASPLDRRRAVTLLAALPAAAAAGVGRRSTAKPLRLFLAPRARVPSSVPPDARRSHA